MDTKSVCLKQLVPGYSKEYQEQKAFYISMYKDYEEELRNLGAQMKFWSKEDEDTFGLQQDTDYFFICLKDPAAKFSLDDVIGFMVVGHGCNCFSTLSGEAYIQDFCILPKYRSRGYGLQIMQLFLSTAPYKAYSFYIYNKNFKARTFWKHVFEGYSDRAALADGMIGKKSGKEEFLFKYYTTEF